MAAEDYIINYYINYYLREIKDLSWEEYETTYLHKLGVEYRLAASMLFNLAMDFDYYCKKNGVSREEAIYTINSLLLPFQQMFMLYAALPRSSQRAKILKNTKLLPMIFFN